MDEYTLATILLGIIFAFLLLFLRGDNSSIETILEDILKFLEDTPKTFPEIVEHIQPETPERVKKLLELLEQNFYCIQKNWRGPINYKTGEKQDPWVYGITIIGKRKLAPPDSIGPKNQHEESS